MPASVRRAVVGWASGRLPALLGVLRRVRPIVSVGRYAVVTRNDDVRAVLEDHAGFTVALYAPKMEAITGPFILGLDDTPLYRHDDVALRAAVREEDLAGIGQAILEGARERMAAGGTLNLVRDVVDPVVERVMATYFGTPGPDGATQIRWAKSLFHDIFLDPQNTPAVHARALADAAEMRPHIDGLIAARKAALRDGEAVPDDVLTRLLKAQGEEPSLRDIAIRHNLIGLIAGWIPTVSKAFTLAIDELFDRPDELAAAQRAAADGDLDRVGAYVFEAMRFRPQASGLLRMCPADRVVAPGTPRATTIRAGTTVLVATQSAMFDPAAVEAPRAFRVDRPPESYLHFGHGLHTCFGLQINRVQLPALALAVLERPRLRRAGKLEMDGPFPSSLAIAA